MIESYYEDFETKILCFYRKGFVPIISQIILISSRLCLKDFDGVGVDFIIGGDGPKRIVIEETIERYGLQAQVQVKKYCLYYSLDVVNIDYEKNNNCVINKQGFSNTRPAEHFSFGLWPFNQFEFETPEINDMALFSFRCSVK